MDIQKIKELALANGFSLKEQASGNMDLHSYVYEFAQAIEQQVLAQARSVFSQDGVTTFDTETLDSEIDLISNSISEKHFFDNDESDELELLVAKSMKLGELYERKKWQAAKAQAVPSAEQALHDRLLVKSIREHVESHILEISVNDLFDKGWLAAMKCVQNNIDMLEAQESAK